MTNVGSIFKSSGVPDATYVRRAEFEKQVNAALDQPGVVCLLTGPSKTGKSTLYSRVLEQRKRIPLRVRCDSSLVPSAFWRQALEQINFSRVTGSNMGKTKSVTAGVSGETHLGWSWLAKISGRLSISGSKEWTEEEAREQILGDPSPQHLLPVLRETNHQFIVEDFHYLSDSTKQQIFQQWKTFVDEEISVIIVGTTHHAIDLANANPDLRGRIIKIELGSWRIDDLEDIVSKGFQALNLPVSGTVANVLARESVGLPIIVQSTCYQLFLDRNKLNIAPIDTESFQEFGSQDAFRALHNVATTRYSEHEDDFRRLVEGPRKKARKYNSYEVVLTSFCTDPVVFSLSRQDLDERMPKTLVSEENFPPPSSITSALRALDTFQKQIGCELLEWNPENQMLHILQPSFLFYLRWRELRLSGTTRDAVSEIIRRFLDNSIATRASQIRYRRRGVRAPRGRTSSRAFDMSHLWTPNPTKQDDQSD